MTTKPMFKKKRRSSKGRRSAIILSAVLIGMMVIRMVAGLVRPNRSTGANVSSVATATAVATPNAQEIAQSALQRYFQLLHDGRYAEAMTYYGGSYDELARLNPDDAASHADLLKDACTQNGYQCLTAKTITRAEAVAADVYTFQVEFAQADGSLLVRPSADAEVDAFAFPFTVKVVEGNYRVQELPVR